MWRSSEAEAEAELVHLGIIAMTALPSYHFREVAPKLNNQRYGEVDDEHMLSGVIRHTADRLSLGSTQWWASVTILVLV